MTHPSDEDYNAWGQRVTPEVDEHVRSYAACYRHRWWWVGEPGVRQYRECSLCGARYWPPGEPVTRDEDGEA